MATEPAVAADKLAGMVADLDGYIERRAGEIAAVRIAAAEERADITREGKDGD